MTLTELDVKRAVRQLATAYGKSLSDKEEADLITIWRVALEGIEASELKEAVKERIKSDSAYFPKGGQIRALALEARLRAGTHHRMSEDPDRIDPAMQCPVCGEKLRLLQPEEQVQMRYDPEEGRTVNILPTSRAATLGILHNLSIHKSVGAPAIGQYGHWPSERAG